MHEPLLFYHSIVFSGCIQLSLYMYANSCSIEAFLLHLAYLTSEFKVGATYISTVQLALFPVFPVLLQDYLLCHLLRYPYPGGLPFCMLFSSNNRTIPAPLPELQIIFFSYVSPLSISLCYLLLHILMRKQGRESRASLLEFSTQMAGNSENGRDFRGCFLRISTQTAQIGKIGRDSKFRRPLSCFHAPINRYPNYNMFLFPLLSSRIIYCYS